MKRIRKCSFMDCPETATVTLVDRFYVAGIRSVAFYDECPKHNERSRQMKPCPGHEPPEYRQIKEEGGKQ